MRVIFLDLSKDVILVSLSMDSASIVLTWNHEVVLHQIILGIERFLLLMSDAGVNAPSDLVQVILFAPHNMRQANIVNVWLI